MHTVLSTWDCISWNSRRSAAIHVTKFIWMAINENTLSVIMLTHLLLSTKYCQIKWRFQQNGRRSKQTSTRMWEDLRFNSFNRTRVGGHKRPFQRDGAAPIPELSGLRHWAMRWGYGSIDSWIFMPLYYSKPREPFPLMNIVWIFIKFRDDHWSLVTGRWSHNGNTQKYRFLILFINLF